MAINLVLLLPLITALEFKLNTPESVNINESFKVSINAETTENYDVKIFIQDNEEKIISEIYNGGWKNPRYYIKSAFPNKTEFEIRALSAGNYEICVRLRKSGKTTFDEACNKIDIKTLIEKEEPLENTEEDKGGNVKIDEDIEEENLEKGNTNNNLENLSEKKANNEYKILENNERIVLNSGNVEKKDTGEVFLTKREKINRGIIYAFLGFSVVIIVLLALRNL